MPTHRPLWRGAPRDVYILCCNGRSAPISGQTVSTVSSHGRVVIGGRLMSCLAVAKYLYFQFKSALALHRFFDDKVAGIRASTDGTDLFTFTLVPACRFLPVGCELRCHQLM